MAIREFLSSRVEDCKRLIELLGEKFAYVSVLGCDVTTKNVVVNRRTSRVETDTDSDKGFVVKMSNGKAFFEYSADDVSGDVNALAQTILSEAVAADCLNDSMIHSRPVADEPLKKDFVRENDFANYTNAQLLECCTAIKDDILSKSENVVNAAVMLRLLDVNKVFVSKNRTLTQAYTWVNGIMVANYREGEKMVGVREGECGNLLGEVMKELPKKTDRLVKKAQKLVAAKPVTPGVYDVITDPSVTGLLAHEAFGHGVEMDMFVKDRALAKSYMGKYVASPICNMRDGAASTLSVASYFFDDDGVLAHDTQIIKDGILVSGISDLVSASELGTEPTGNGRRQDHARKAYSRMTNTFFERGTDKLEDMIASIKHGYMIFETNNGMEDPKNWAIQCVAEYGIEIVDGKLTENYVSPVVMSGYVPDVLKSISMISDDFIVEGTGFCGKGHKEWVRVSDGGPALKLRVKLG
ncbi:MAG: TldD/PmbA family protein [Clostridia bacterium]|nr:TldD/PmbA family protein [Clostridia bacterium]